MNKERDIETVHVTLFRKRLDGTGVPGVIVELTRVPCVGEHVGFAQRSNAPPEDAPAYRVTAVLHIPIIEDQGAMLAEIYAVEIEGEVGHEGGVSYP